MGLRVLYANALAAPEDHNIDMSYVVLPSHLCGRDKTVRISNSRLSMAAIVVPRLRSSRLKRLQITRKAARALEQYPKGEQENH